jgi:hypothetical protein
VEHFFSSMNSTSNAVAYGSTSFLFFLFIGRQTLGAAKAPSFAGIGIINITLASMSAFVASIRAFP